MGPVSSRKRTAAAKRLFGALLRLAGSGIVVISWAGLEWLLWDLGTPFWFLTASMFASGFALTALMGILSSRHDTEENIREDDRQGFQ